MLTPNYELGTSLAFKSRACELSKVSAHVFDNTSRSTLLLGLNMTLANVLQSIDLSTTVPVPIGYK